MLVGPPLSADDDGGSAVPGSTAPVIEPGQPGDTREAPSGMRPDPPADWASVGREEQEARVATDATLLLRKGAALLADAVRRQPRVFALAVSGSAVYALMTVLSATVIGRITDHTILPAFRTGHTTAAALTGAAGAILIVAAAKSAGITLRRIGAGTMEYRLEAAYRRAVTRQYLRLPLRWHQARPTGELLSTANSDVEAMFWPIAPFPFACGVAVMLIATAVQLFLVDALLAAIGLCLFPAIFVVNAVYSRAQAPIAARAQQLRGELAGVAHESFDGALVVKTLGREDVETARFAERADELRAANVAIGRIRGLFDPVMEALPIIGVLLVMYAGSLRVSTGAITTGSLVKVAYLFLQISFPVRAVGWVLAEMPRAIVGRQRVLRVLSATGAMPAGEARLGDASDGVGLRLDRVRFGYLDDTDVLHAVDLDLTPGRTLALVGPTGAGKTTVATLLVRLVDPASGSVSYDGVDVRTLATGEVSDAAALVAQSTFLFDDTVRGNVTLGADVDDQQIWRSLRLARADGFVSALSAGLDTKVGERGTTLSGGQRQRLALARALVRRPRLLVLDDATSSVDPDIERSILTGLREAAVQGELTATVVLIAYRRATIALADEVAWVEGGRVLARGRHDELVAAVPGYAELVSAYEHAGAHATDPTAAGR